MVRQDLRDSEGYCHTTVRSKDIKGYMERDWVIADFLGLLWEGKTGSMASLWGPGQVGLPGGEH
jgi:hypothetical protein